MAHISSPTASDIVFRAALGVAVSCSGIGMDAIIVNCGPGPRRDKSGKLGQYFPRLQTQNET